MTSAASSAGGPGKALEVLLSFLRLGLTSFGGPVAHLGYFRTEFVERRRWIDERAYADLVALCQFLPGPASSQVGMALGLGRAGWLGALAAWVGLTLPSAVILVLFAWGITAAGELAASGLVQGLKIAAVAVVAQAVWGMGRSLCPDRTRFGLAILSALLTLALPSALGQIGAIVVSGLLGAWFLKLPEPTAIPTASFFAVSRRASLTAAAVFLALFTFAAYVGAVMEGPVTGVCGAAILLVAVFLPAFLLVVAALPYWESLRRRPDVQSTMAGVNAGVVGLLLSALYDPSRWPPAPAGHWRAERRAGGAQP